MSSFSSLQGDQTPTTKKQFTDFVLVVENIDLEQQQQQQQQQQERRFSGSAGSYQLLGDVLTRFSDHCTNTVTQASNVQKTEIQVKIKSVNN